jgi:hypothetical protein
LRKHHHKTRVTVGMKEDLKVWLTFLSNYNGTTVIVDKVWSSSTTLEFFVYNVHDGLIIHMENYLFVS